MNYIAAYAYIMQTLENRLPRHLYYHNPPHTMDVIQAAESIARQSNTHIHDIQLIRTAALFHDTGLIITYKNHEEASVNFAREHLPEFGYNEEQIDRIASLIMATKMPQQPQCELAEILCDADLDYLGRPDYLAISHKLRLEWQYALQFSESLLKWYQMQYEFLSNHRYFTAISRKNRDQGKLQNLQLIKELLDKD